MGKDAREKNTEEGGKLRKVPIRADVDIVRIGGYRSFANGILEAWSEKNLPRFRDELENASSLDAADSLPPEERERTELVAGIAAEMRGIVASGDLDEADVYLGLLRHLACSPSR
jgi:hypothetical protein